MDDEADSVEELADNWTNGNRKDAVRAFLALDDRDDEARALGLMFGARPDWRDVGTFVRLVRALEVAR